MKVTYVDHMGSDESVVNAARVSFSKEAAQYTEEQNNKLIRYLAHHNHWTPFGHTSVTLHIKAPLFVARQLGKHQVGLVWNEVSRRYIDDEPEFYEPEIWRRRADNVKQGSSEEPFHFDGLHGMFTEYLSDHIDDAVQWYNKMLEAGCCPEQARMILPQSLYTEWYWTGSLVAFSRVYALRIDSHTQKETQEVAKQIGVVMEGLYPESWKALTGG